MSMLLALWLTFLPSPAEEAAARRDALSRKVGAHLAALPGVARASVLIAEPPTPLLGRLDAAPVPAHPSISALVVLRAGAHSPASAAELRALVAAAVPAGRADDVHLVITPEAAPPPDPLVALGPFRVAEASFAPLAGTLAGALLLLFLLGVLLYRGEKTRAQGEKPGASGEKSRGTGEAT
jgi:type III secretory pathway lipoprotein EscJ